MSQYYGNGSAGPGGTPERFVRARYGRVLGGLCMSLARRINLDVSLVRIITVVLSFATSGTVALIYLIAWVIVPEEGWDAPPPGGNGGGPWQGGHTGTYNASNGQDGNNDSPGGEAQGAQQGAGCGSAHNAYAGGNPGQGAPDSGAPPRRNDAIIFGGILLLLGGYLLLNHLFGAVFQMRYFIPLALMSLGVYIIYRATGRKD